MKKNVAVLGCGYWGKNLVRNFYEIGALYGIFDKDTNMLESMKSKYPEISCFDNYGEMLNNPQVQGVVISTPAETHYILAKKAFEADKDVYIEKPIALKMSDGKELVQLAKTKNKILMIGHILEYHPAIMKIKEFIDKGELGKLQYIYSNRLNLGKFRSEENILWSFAPHDISVILRLIGEMPTGVFANGGNYLNEKIADVTVSTFDFPSGVKSHIFVSWLHPFKEQKLVVIGDKKMMVFDDVKSKDKLQLYEHKIDWINRVPVPTKKEAIVVEIDSGEPLKQECSHFLECMEKRQVPLTDGENGLKVLQILEACQKSLKEMTKVSIKGNENKRSYFVHKSSFIDENVTIGKDTKIWHFTHILKNTTIGEKCSLGQNVVAGPNVTIGNNVKIQNNVSIYDGVCLEDDVFCGPSMVFTNVINPRSHWPRKDEYQKTLVKKGVSMGANSTIVCGHTIGRFAFVGAGALVNFDVPDYALVYGVPARIRGWMCFCGNKLELSSALDTKENCSCQSCGRKYKKERLSVKEI